MEGDETFPVCRIRSRGGEGIQRQSKSTFQTWSGFKTAGGGEKKHVAPTKSQSPSYPFSESSSFLSGKKDPISLADKGAD